MVDTMQNTHKRRRDDVGVAVGVPWWNCSNSAPGAMVAGSSIPLQLGDDQSLALEQVLEMVAAGQGEQTGTNPQQLAGISLRMMKFLREKQEIEKALVTMRMCQQQAVHIAEQQKMVGMLKSREEENLVLKRDLEALRAQLATTAQPREQMLNPVPRDSERDSQLNPFYESPNGSDSSDDYGSGPYDWNSEHSSDDFGSGLHDGNSHSSDDSGSASSNDSNLVLDPDMVERMKTTFEEYDLAVEIYCNYVHKKWAERTGRGFRHIETLEELLKIFRISEDAHETFKKDFSQVKHLIWEHWVSSVMFKDFEDPLYGLEDLTAQEMVDSRTLNYKSLMVFHKFCIKKYVEIFPQWLLQQLQQSRGVDRDECGRFEGDKYFRAKFAEVAKSIWFLHELASSSHLLGSLLRVSPGTVFKKELHLWVAHIWPYDPITVDIMLTPGFCVGNEVIFRSRVLCTEQPIE
ncbi:hypothetical protein KC19_8G156500 [Ceratodon purpureus]|uniref:Uncharacterized protein n=1 Tax=Ceratodon purpureus TaxID=3225 RepID=A0A8T0H4F6_CERPU|nr:hypothetical protein KC19_8G156500 [Ceratodon purpureus]